MSLTFKGFGLAALIALCGQTAAAGENWKITGLAPETSLYHQLFVEKFADHMRAISGGDVSIQTFGGGVLAPATQLHDAVQSGIVETAITTAVYLVNQDPVNSYFGTHPGGMDGSTLMAWYMAGDAEDLLQEYRRDRQGLHAMLCGIGPAEVFMHSHVKVQNADDLKGKKIRAAGAWAAILDSEFGAVPTTVPGSEIFTLLERKAIDGAEFSTIADNLQMGFHDAAPWIIVPGMHVRSFAMEFIMEAGRWDALPDHTKAQVQAACEATTLESFHEWSKKDIDAVANMSEEDQARVVRISDELLAQIETAGRSWGSAKAAEAAEAGDPFMQRVVDSYYSFKESWEGTTKFRGQ